MVIRYAEPNRNRPGYSLVVLLLRPVVAADFVSVCPDGLGALRRPVLLTMTANTKRD
jgi:hypothetical protein